MIEGRYLYVRKGITILVVVVVLLVMPTSPAAAIVPLECECSCSLPIESYCDCCGQPVCEKDENCSCCSVKAPKQHDASCPIALIREGFRFDSYVLPAYVLGIPVHVERFTTIYTERFNLRDIVNTIFRPPRSLDDNGLCPQYVHKVYLQCVSTK